MKLIVKLFSHFTMKWEWNILMGIFTFKYTNFIEHVNMMVPFRAVIIFKPSSYAIENLAMFNTIRLCNSLNCQSFRRKWFRKLNFSYWNVRHFPVSNSYLKESKNRHEENVRFYANCGQHFECEPYYMSLPKWSW